MPEDVKRPGKVVSSMSWIIPPPCVPGWVPTLILALNSSCATIFQFREQEYREDLQRALNIHGAGLVVDGIPGKQTRQMLQTVLAQTGESEFLSTLNERRKSFYHSCKQFPVFGKGWLNRSNEAYRFAQSLI